MRYELEYIGKKETLNINDDNVDIYITFENGSKYVCTFFTLKNIERLMLGYQKSGECAHGKYFWSKNMLIVESLDEKTVKECINDLIARDDLDLVFDRV